MITTKNKLARELLLDLTVQMGYLCTEEVWNCIVLPLSIENNKRDFRHFCQDLNFFGNVIASRIFDMYHGIKREPDRKFLLDLTVQMGYLCTEEE